jgi:hypothetical protein
MGGTVRALALFTTLLAVSAAAQERRGAFAFHYASPLTAAQLRRFARFDLVVTHDPLPREQVDFLHAHGTKLLVYEWSVAFYGSLATEWQRGLLQRHGEALLNRVGLRGGSGSPEADAWYYDPASEQHRVRRAREIARRLAGVGYDGVFLDTTTAESVHPAALEEFRRRHPDDDYDREYARFLANLRRELGKKLIFTNQGYRRPEEYLEYADWDLTESLITWKGGVPRPWDDPNDPWNSVHFLFTHVLEPLRARFPHVRFAHLNYGDAGVVPLVVATAKLFGDAGYVADADSPLYFVDLGAAREARVDRAGASYRLFRHGFVAVNASTQPLVVRGTTVPACGERCPVAVVARR